MGAFESFFVPIHRAGWLFVALFAAVALVLYFVSPPLALLGVVATVWCAYFFRDPDRVVPIAPGIVVSPADGRIVGVGPARPPDELGLGDGPLTRISIFLNVFDVHVNRVPADGTIEAAVYHPGKFLNAALDKASEDNERASARLRTPDGLQIGFVQIAGLIARRIVTDLSPGRQVKAGERFGIIRFGSRMDVYLAPEHVTVVSVGQRAIGGETVLAEVGSGNRVPRGGEVR